MTQKIRFGDYVHEVSVHQYEISYNDLAPKVETDASGEMVPVKQTKLALKTSDMYLLKPYLSVRFMDQVRAVVPLAVYLFLFQIIVLRQAVQDSWMISGGLFAVIIGLMLFMEGLTLGLMPFGETIRKHASDQITPARGAAHRLLVGCERDLCRTRHWGPATSR